LSLNVCYISSDGEILHASGQRMEVADIVTFATGSRHVSASMDKTISVRYVYPAMNSYMTFCIYVQWRFDPCCNIRLWCF